MTLPKYAQTKIDGQAHRIRELERELAAARQVGNVPVREVLKALAIMSGRLKVAREKHRDDVKYWARDTAREVANPRADDYPFDPLNGSSVLDVSRNATRISHIHETIHDVTDMLAEHIGVDPKALQRLVISHPWDTAPLEAAVTKLRAETPASPEEPAP